MQSPEEQKGLSPPIAKVAAPEADLPFLRDLVEGRLTVRTEKGGRRQRAFPERERLEVAVRAEIGT